MKREFVERVKNRLVHVLDESQMQELEMAITICLDGLQLQKECTELSTEVIDNWEYCKRYLQYLIVSGKSKGTIGNYGMHLKLLFEDIRKQVGIVFI